MNLLIIGIQGSGKGTQSERIVSKYQLHHLEAGQLIRDSAHQHSRKAEIIDHLANKKGELLPDGIVIDMIANKLESTGFDNNLFDGFPRTHTQYQALKEILTHNPLSLAIQLTLTDDQALERMSSRRSCSTCHKTFSLILEPERTKCDCGGDLTTRPDDQPEQIKHRLEIFHHQTEPLIQALSDDHILSQIDGSQSPDQVFNQIVAILDPIS